jgi:hypothetical protein
MKTSIKFKGCEFRFRPHFSHLEFEVHGTSGRATGKLTPSDCLELGKFLMDAYYAHAFRPDAGSEDAAKPD